MTAKVCAALACDSPGCERKTWTLLETWTIADMRRVAGQHGWVHAGDKDWCPQHAAQRDVCASGRCA